MNFRQDTKIKQTNLAHKVITAKMINIDNHFKNETYDINKVYRFLKKPKQFTKFGYVTIIFIDSKYISSILNTGYTLKKNTDNDIICFVQDKPAYGFPGLTIDEINDIKKIYDVVIGIDLCNINTVNTETNETYINITYYCTKSLCVGFSYYKKLIYLDASTFIIKNIDLLFEKYDKSTYYITKYTNIGLVGNFYIFIPAKYYFFKAQYLIKNYNTVFKNHNTLYTIDETITFYTIFPNWNRKPLNTECFQFNWSINPYPIKHKYNYSIHIYMIEKQFRYSIAPNIKNRNMFSLNYAYLYTWDLAVKKLIKKFPDFIKYFEYIKTFRYTAF